MITITLAGLHRWRERAPFWAIEVERYSPRPTEATLSRGLGPRSHPKARVQRRLLDAIEPFMASYAEGDADARALVFRSVADVLTA